MTVRALQLVSYPTASPRHGGQIRAARIRQALEQAGILVEEIAIFNTKDFPGEKPEIDLKSASILGPFSSYWQINDYSGGFALAHDPVIAGAFRSAIARRSFDVIVAEELWCGRGLKALRDSGNLPQPVIYNSYNLEHVAKKFILERADIPVASEAVAAIQDLERDFCAMAASCSAVTQSDADALSRWSAQPVAVARNGATRRKLDHLQGILPIEIGARDNFLLFVGSAHPPNVFGFCDLIGESLRALRVDERVVVAGAACHSIWAELQARKISFMTRDKLIFVKEVSDFALSCLYANARGVVLPITFGGGSNLKAAEALVLGLPIAGTTAAFRGFEHFIGEANVRIGDTAKEFGTAMRALFDGACTMRTATPANVDELLWSHTLQPIVDLVRKVATAHRAA